MNDTKAVAYIMQHTHEMEDGSEDVKFLGVFSSRKNAEYSIAAYRSIEGFRDSPDGFYIDEYEIDKPAWLHGYITVA